jgi:hypothetical protein
MKIAIVRETEKLDAESSRDNPSDSTIDIHILGNRYINGLGADGPISSS